MEAGLIKPDMVENKDEHKIKITASKLQAISEGLTADQRHLLNMVMAKYGELNTKS